MRYITPYIILVGCDAGCFVNLSDINDLLRLTVNEPDYLRDLPPAHKLFPPLLNRNPF